MTDEGRETDEGRDAAVAITPAELIEAGLRPGKWMPAAIAAANQAHADGASRKEALAAGLALEPVRLALEAAGSRPIHIHLDAANEAERANKDAVVATMTEVLRTPPVREGAVMPDACPAGPLGTIPVGGIVSSTMIHPGMHSADICCSMALTAFPGRAPGEVLDAVHAVTHFGPGGRKDAPALPREVEDRFAANPLLCRIQGMDALARTHFATQGDGNHFAYVGTLRSSGETVLVTHHGSRGPGGVLYKEGMALAERARRRGAPTTLKQNAWLDPDTTDGEAYWDALQAIRLWTRESHFAIHDLAADRMGARRGARFWNEHNFVFRRTDGLFYHAKGATPAFPGWAADAGAETIIPLNMREPILIVRGRDAPGSLGFSPHGAGRNMSRTAHKKALGDEPDEAVFARETKGIDARFFFGAIDVSELPSAYKDAAAVREQIDRFGLAEIVDEVVPHGSIMAGDWERDAPWKKKARAKREARERAAREA